jgi:hypothetical protein
MVAEDCKPRIKKELCQRELSEDKLIKNEHGEVFVARDVAHLVPNCQNHSYANERQAH